MRTILLTAILIMPAFATGAQAQGFGTECTPAGTWYGGAEGSGAKYLLTVTRVGLRDFAATFDPGFVPKVSHLTAFSGRLDQRSRHTYEAHVIALVNLTPTPPPDGGPAAEVWAVHGLVTMRTCSTLEFVIDFFGGYAGGAFWGVKSPFQDEPDYLRLAEGLTIVETYRRVPTPAARADQMK
jgi:hypothetical protein